MDKIIQKSFINGTQSLSLREHYLDVSFRRLNKSYEVSYDLRQYIPLPERHWKFPFLSIFLTVLSLLLTIAVYSGLAIYGVYIVFFKSMEENSGILDHLGPFLIWGIVGGVLIQVVYACYSHIMKNCYDHWEFTSFSNGKSFKLFHDAPSTKEFDPFMKKLLEEIKKHSGYKRSYRWNRFDPDELINQFSTLHRNGILNDQEFAALKLKVHTQWEKAETDA